MAIWRLDNGANKPTTVYANNSTEMVYQVYCKIGTTWRQVYKYSWYVQQNYGGCSVTCGGGVQTRDVHCEQSSPGVGVRTVPDKFCVKYGLGAKPQSSKSCNTHSCNVGVYIYTSYDDHHSIGYFRRSDNAYVKIYNNCHAGKHGDGDHYDKVRNFHFSEFPIRFVFYGWNTSNKGGPRGTLVGIDGKASHKVTPDHPNYRDAHFGGYFELDVNNKINKIRCYDKACLYQGFKEEKHNQAPPWPGCGSKQAHDYKCV